jgi:hypothetical protein
MRQQVLADFFVGAQAAVEGWPLLTRDASRFRTCFPGLTVLAPELPGRTDVASAAAIPARPARAPRAPRVRVDGP